jgi:TatA/E family protein of Tat protein translocase
MFGIGMTELVVILVIALLIFGPNKLPELARSLGKGFGEFRRASYDLRQSLMEATEEPPPPQAPPQAESRMGAAQPKTTPTPEDPETARADPTPPTDERPEGHS